MAESLLETMASCGLTGETWAAWRVAAKCLDAEPLEPTEQAIFEQCTHRTRPPSEPPAEFYGICGRRSGKSRVGGAGTSRALSRRYSSLAPGESAVAAVAASDRAQARTLFNYASAPFTTPMRGAVRALADLVTRRTRWELNLATGTNLEVHTAHFGRVRGRTFCVAVADELAFWQSEDGSNPASEVLNAIRPGLATLGGQLIGISTPFAKAGALWDVYARYFGKDDDGVLVWQAPSRTMNPLIPERVVLGALERDPEAAKAEWLGEFRDDAAGLLTDAMLRAAVIVGRTADLPRLDGVDYLPFVDAATGGGADAMAMAIAHVEQEGDGRLVAVIDAAREVRPPFNPEDVVREFATLARAYGCVQVWGDRFAKGFTDAAFARHGLYYIPSELTRSELYVALLALINARSVELPAHERLVRQLLGLQRRAGAAGREQVDHPSHGHDDLANVCAGAAVLVHRLASAPVPPPLRVFGG